MTGVTFSASPAEIALCLTCELPACDGGSPDCPWGQVYWYEPDKEHRREYIREYNRLRRHSEQERERRKRRGEND